MQYLADQNRSSVGKSNSWGDLQRNIANKSQRQKLFAVYQAVSCLGINSSDAAFFIFGIYGIMFMFHKYKYFFHMFTLIWKRNIKKYIIR